MARLPLFVWFSPAGGAEARGLKWLSSPNSGSSHPRRISEDPPNTHAPRLELARLPRENRERMTRQHILLKSRSSPIFLRSSHLGVDGPVGCICALGLHKASAQLESLLAEHCRQTSSPSTRRSEGELGLQRLRVQHGVLRLGRLDKPVLSPPHSVPSSRRRQRRSWILPV